ncbi:MAG: CoA ester lyase [Rhizobiales bacterium]|nr:CoA ester lyase [Hyphomicrobiales bacterium]
MNNQRPLPVWRSLLYVPVNVERFIAKATQRGADGLILDLEDSIPPGEKESARAMLEDVVMRLSKAGRCDLLVRINQPLELAVRDIEAAVLAQVSGFVIAKVEGPDHLRLLDELVTRIESERGLVPGHIRFLGSIEAPGPLLRAPEIARSTPRLAGLSLGTEDYATAIGGRPVEDVMMVPKQQVLQAASAAGLMAFGTMGSVAGFADLEEYAGAARRAATFGFSGSPCIHPTQVPILNQAFSPSPEEVAKAQKIVDLDHRSASEGRGSFAIDGMMIDIPVVQRAEALLARAKAIAER